MTLTTTDGSKLTPAAPQSRGFWLLLGVALAACVGAAYQRALGVGFLTDDHLMLAFAQNAPIDGSVFAVNPVRWLLFHRPLALLVWQLMYAAWGLNPLPYHLLSLALHALNSLLIARLVDRIAPGDRAAAVAAGLIFALLPLHVEAVVWVACWFDLLALAFALLALVCLVNAWERRRLGWYLLSVLACQLAVWSKESAFALPALALLVALVLAPRPPVRLLLGALVPYGLVVAANLLQRYLVWGSLGGYQSVPTNVLPFLWDRLLGAAGVLAAPLNRAVVPPELVQATGAVTATLLLLGLIAGGRRRLALLGVGWAALALVPVFSVLTVGLDLQNARLLYPVSAGYAILLAASLANLTDLLRPRLRAVAQLGLAVALGAAALVAVRAQVQPWLVASRATDAIVAQVDAALPRPRVGTYLQVIGRPDNHRGAYMLRLGLDVPLLTGGKGLYLNWHEPAPVPIPYDELDITRGFFQVQLRADPGGERWEVTQVRGVTTDGPQPPLPSGHWIFGMRGAALVERLSRETPERAAAQRWDLSDCQTTRQWQMAGLALECSGGEGVIIRPEGSDPTILLTGVRLRPDRWAEVVVGIEALAPTSQAAVQLYWGSQATGLDEARSASIELPTAPRPQRYHFFIAPSAAAPTVDMLRLDPINRAVPVRITSVEVRQAP